MARGVDEGDRALDALQLGDDLVGADVLGDAAGLALADVGLADRVQQARLSVVDVTHDRDDRRPELEVVVVAGVLAVGDREAVEQLPVLLLRADDLHHVVHLGAEQLEDLVGHRLGGGDHLTEVEQHLHQRGRVRVDLVCEVRQRGATGQLDRLAAALGQADAADRGGLHRVELLALLPLRLATLAGRTAGTAERARRTTAATAAGTTGTATAATGTTAETATGRGTAPTGAAATGTETPATATAGTPTGTARTRTRTTGTPAGTAGAATAAGTGTPRSRTRRHHAGVRTRGHVARRRGTRAALTGTTRTGSTGTRPAGTGTALAGSTRCGRGRGLAALCRGATLCGRAGTRGDGARRGAGADAERVVAHARGARTGPRAGRLRRDDGAAGVGLLRPRRGLRTRRSGRCGGGRRGNRDDRAGTGAGARAGARGTRGVRAGRGRGGRGLGAGRLRRGHRGLGLCRRGLRDLRLRDLWTGARPRAGGRSGSGNAAGTGAARLGGAVAGTSGHGLPQLAGDRGLDGGGRGLHVLPEILQLAQDLLAADAELFCELVHAGLACHCTPCFSEAGGWSRSTSNLVSKHVHGAIFTTGS